MNQSEFLAFTRNLLKAWEKLCVQGTIGFGFAPQLKNWRETFELTTGYSNRNSVITFNSHLKTALCNQIQHGLVFAVFHGDNLS